MISVEFTSGFAICSAKKYVTNTESEYKERKHRGSIKQNHRAISARLLHCYQALHRVRALPLFSRLIRQKAQSPEARNHQATLPKKKFFFSSTVQTIFLYG